MIKKKYPDSELNSIATLIKESRISLATDKEKAILNVLVALDATLDVLSTLIDDGSNENKPIAKPYIPREKLIGEKISTVGMTHIYKYAHDDGSVFNAESINLLECVNYKDAWLEQGYSPFIKVHISIYARKNNARNNSKYDLNNACIACIFGGYAVLCQDELNYFSEKGLVVSSSPLKKRKLK